jgi:hypothetical protein
MRRLEARCDTGTTDLMAACLALRRDGSADASVPEPVAQEMAQLQKLQRERGALLSFV